MERGRARVGARFGSVCRGLVLAAVVALTAACSPSQSPALASPQPFGFVRGVDHASWEYGSPTAGAAPCAGDGPFGVSQLQALRAGWGAGMVRVPLSANSWLGDWDARHGSHYAVEGDICPGYDAQVEALAAAAAQAQVRLLLVLAYVDPCGQVVTNLAGAGYDLPGEAEARAFWSTLAGDSKVGGNPWVWFDAYSEPHDISWEQWYAGGQVTQLPDSHRAGCTYQAAGMAELVTAIRAAAPQRDIVVSGNDWGGNITRVAAYDFPKDHLWYGVHIYPGPQTQDESRWPRWFAAMDSQPVLATEFGGDASCQTAWVDDLMLYLRQHARGMLAWGYNKGSCSSLRMLGPDGQVNAYGANIQGFFVEEAMDD